MELICSADQTQVPPKRLNSIRNIVWKSRKQIWKAALLAAYKCFTSTALKNFRRPNFALRTSNVRPQQWKEICNLGSPSPLEALHWIFCSFSSIYVQFSKTSPLKSGESSEKSSGENRVKSCHVCGCHGFFGPERVKYFAPLQSTGVATLTESNQKPPLTDPRFMAWSLQEFVDFWRQVKANGYKEDGCSRCVSLVPLHRPCAPEEPKTQYTGSAESWPNFGRTPTGSYSRKGVILPSSCLLESPFLEPLLRTLLRTLPSCKTHCTTPSKNPSQNLLESSLENPSKNPS